MADTTVADFLNVTPAVITTSGTVAKSLNFVQLGATNIALVLPTAVAGRWIKVVVSSHTGGALQNRVVTVAPGTGDTINGGTTPVETWELHSSLTFVAVDATDWQVVDFL